MEDLSMKVPLMNRIISKKLDGKTLANFKESSRGIEGVMAEDRSYWIRILRKHNVSFTEFQDAWKKVVTTKTSFSDVKQLSLAVHQFFKTYYPHNQYHPLHIAIFQGSTKLCKHVLEKTRYSNPKRIQDGKTLLHFAAELGYLKVCKIITKNLVDKNPADNDGWTPLHYAAENGHPKVCKIIMESLVDKNPADNDGWTPLHSAAENGHLKVYKVIMESLVDKNPADNDGWTPLHLAAQNGHLEVCKLICQNIEDKNPSEHMGHTPISLARLNGNQEILSYLEEINNLNNPTEFILGL